MDSGYYAACSALKAQTNALEVVANNVANVSTAGYRGQIPSFAALVAASGMRQSGWERLTDEFSVLNGTRLDLAEGTLSTPGIRWIWPSKGRGFSRCKLNPGLFTPATAAFACRRQVNWSAPREIRCWGLRGRSQFRRAK